MSRTTACAVHAGADPRCLIDPALFDRLTARITSEHGTTPEFSARVMEQALAYLRACAADPGAALAPSPSVDLGWHAFILHTREYAEFCHRVAGRFIHHVPEGGAGSPEASARPYATTTRAIRAAGLPVDDELWSSTPPPRCSNGGGPGGPGGGCHQGCHNSN
jgi:hypothetical protein